MTMRFSMSEQIFEFRPQDPITADEFWIVDELLGDTSMEQLLNSLADGLTGRRTIRSTIKEFCVAAFLAYRRDGGRAEWPEFSRSLVPATLKLLPSEPPPTPPPGPGDGVAQEQPGDPVTATPSEADQPPATGIPIVSPTAAALAARNATDLHPPDAGSAPA